MRLGVVQAAWVVLAAAVPVQAQQLTSNDFNIDAVTTPVLGSSRIVGMGGAYTALADGIDGVAWNPAAYGSRYRFELEWWEWDLALSLFGPGMFGMDDFFNNGAGVNADAFFFANLGLRFQFDHFGFGFDFRAQLFDMQVLNRITDTDEIIDIDVMEYRLGMAYGFFSGQLVVGLGGRGTNLVMGLPGAQEDLITFTGLGPEAGVLLRIADQPWRLGIAGRLPAVSEAEPGQLDDPEAPVKTVRGYVLPEKVIMPWEIQVGFAFQFGARPFNLKYSEPHDAEDSVEERFERKRCRRAEDQVREELAAKGEEIPAEFDCPGVQDEPEDPAWWEQEERLRAAEDEAMEIVIEEAEENIYWQRRRAYESLERFYLLLSADVIVIGPTDNAIRVDAFLEQERRDAGEEVAVGVRLGAECEPVANIMKVRAGFYLEPPRTAEAGYRPHGTAGVVFRLFRWDLFGAFNPFDVQVSLTGDVGPRYLDLGIGVGFWH